MILGTILSLLLIVVIITFLALLIPTLLVSMFLLAFMMTSPPRGSTLTLEWVRVLGIPPRSRPRLRTQEARSGDYVELEQFEVESAPGIEVEERSTDRLELEARGMDDVEERVRGCEGANNVEGQPERRTAEIMARDLTPTDSSIAQGESEPIEERCTEVRDLGEIHPGPGRC